MLQLAKKRIQSYPAKYIKHIYREKEAGGTSWLYIFAIPFGKLGFPNIPKRPPSNTTESIQKTMFMGLISLIARYTFGLWYVTNLTNSHPWGLWISIDVVVGVALAAGGFTTAALAHIFDNRYYETITRPALLTAAIGYTFVAFGVFLDIGRSWAIWKPLFFKTILLLYLK